MFADRGQDCGQQEGYLEAWGRMFVGVRGIDARWTIGRGALETINKYVNTNCYAFFFFP